MDHLASQTTIVDIVRTRASRFDSKRWLATELEGVTISEIRGRGRRLVRQLLALFSPMPVAKSCIVALNCTFAKEAPFNAVVVNVCQLVAIMSPPIGYLIM